MAGNREEERTEAHRHRIGLTTSQVAASALAASCAAIVASYLGVAGTISGAAIGSIVATTGSAFYGHAFHTGGKKIVKRLGPNTFLLSGPKGKAAITVQASTTIAPEPTTTRAPAGPPGPKQSRYRKAGALAAALLVVFGAAITVGLLAGGAIRQSGTGITEIPPQFATRSSTATRPAGSNTPPTPTTSPSAATPASTTPGSVRPSGSPGITRSSDPGAASPPATNQRTPGP
ncbi:MAG TPA: hypothetical protein VFU74_19930 [Actinocrinis sp.]|nr:hypothetical protein [Actinocrinis sp.]